MSVKVPRHGESGWKKPQKRASGSRMNGAAERVMGRAIRKAVVLGACAFALAACGVRGNLERPNSAANPTGSADEIVSGGAAEPTAKPKAHRPSVLDGLLR